jgi:hypothetical protein
VSEARGFCMLPPDSNAQNKIQFVHIDDMAAVSFILEKE